MIVAQAKVVVSVGLEATVGSKHLQIASLKVELVRLKGVCSEARLIVV
jgi:hypothetical protein